MIRITRGIGARVCFFNVKISLTLLFFHTCSDSEMHFRNLFFVYKSPELGRED